MLKTVTARVYENGKWGLPTSDTLGANYENGVSELVIEIPAAYHAYDCYLEFKKPSGACLSTEKLTATQDANMIWVIRITISNTIVDEPGEYLVDFVGRSGDDVVKTNKQLILNVSRNVNAAEYLEDYKIDFITSTEQRLKALEDAGDGGWFWFANLAAFPVTGVSDTGYVAKDTGVIYRWNGTTYETMSPALTIGEAEGTAYDGLKGKEAHEHISKTDNPHGVTKAQVGLANVDNTSDANKPVSTAQSEAIELNKIYGKKIAFLGDSLTQGNGMGDADYLTKRFSTLVSAYFGATELNYGASGTSIAENATITTTAFCNRYTSMNDTADIIIVLGGTNDYYFNEPLGTIASTAKTTFYGALKTLIGGLCNKYVGKRIIILTPPHRDPNIANAAGVTFNQYINAIKDVAQYYGVELYDMYGNLPFNRTNTAGLAYMADAVHPNALGNSYMATVLERYLKFGVGGSFENRDEEVARISAIETGKVDKTQTTENIAFSSFTGTTKLSYTFTGDHSFKNITISGELDLSGVTSNEIEILVASGAVMTGANIRIITKDLTNQVSMTTRIFLKDENKYPHFVSAYSTAPTGNLWSPLNGNIYEGSRGGISTCAFYIYSTAITNVKMYATALINYGISYSSVFIAGYAVLI